MVSKVLCNKAKTQNIIDRKKKRKGSVTKLYYKYGSKRGECHNMKVKRNMRTKAWGRSITDLKEHVAGGQRLSRVSWWRLRGRRRGREAETVVQDWTVLHSSVWLRLLMLLVVLQEARLQTGVTQNGVRFIDHVVSWTGVVGTFPWRLNPPKGTHNKNIRLDWWSKWGWCNNSTWF